MTETGTVHTPPAAGEPVRRDGGLLATLVVAAVAGAALFLTARSGATALLIAVAVLQGALPVAWMFGTRQPGRIGGLLIAGAAAAGADVAVSVSPHGRLGVLLPVLGLALPVMFVHQLVRGTARSRVVTSLSGVAVLVLAQVAVAAYVQLRHELVNPRTAGHVVAAAAGAVAVALVAGCLVDVVVPVPRFDPRVPRGLPSVLVSAVVGAVFVYLSLRDGAGGRSFSDGRALFVGAALGALAGLVAVAAAFAEHEQTEATTRLRTALRRVLTALLPLFLLGPVAFLLCLAVRS